MLARGWASKPVNIWRVRLVAKRHLSLAYALYQPAGLDVDPGKEPLIILHGLFGSKQNNRSISKYVPRFGPGSRPVFAGFDQYPGHWHET